MGSSKGSSKPWRPESELKAVLCAVVIQVRAQQGADNEREG